MAYDAAIIKFHGVGGKTNFPIPMGDVDRSVSEVSSAESSNAVTVAELMVESPPPMDLSLGNCGGGSADGGFILESSSVIDDKEKTKRIEIDLNFPPPLKDM
ncbi:hypothetical protein P3S68_003561 [Capsicum galapagoense]